MSNRVAVITGATGGIGKVVCKYLIANGYTVYAACRNTSKGEALRKYICAANSNAGSANNLVFVPLDLKSFASVQEFCNTIIERITASGNSIELLINNAGIIAPAFEITKDGYESTMQVNYLSGKAITETLLPYINGKIINTVSCTIHTGDYTEPVKADVIAAPKRINSAKSLKIYSNSKLMLALYSIDLHNRLKRGIELAADSGNGTVKVLKTLSEIKVYGADPGIVNTGIITMHRWYDPIANIFFRPFIKTAEQGAAPIINAIEYGQSASGNCNNGNTYTQQTDTENPMLFISKKAKGFPANILKIYKRKQA